MAHRRWLPFLPQSPHACIQRYSGVRISCTNSVKHTGQRSRSLAGLPHGTARRLGWRGPRATKGAKAAALLLLPAWATPETRWRRE